jgi:hypothetical protein
VVPKVRAVGRWMLVAIAAVALLAAVALGFCHQTYSNAPQMRVMSTNFTTDPSQWRRERVITLDLKSQ